MFEAHNSDNSSQSGENEGVELNDIYDRLAPVRGRKFFSEEQSSKLTCKLFTEAFDIDDDKKKVELVSVSSLMKLVKRNDYPNLGKMCLYSILIECERYGDVSIDDPERDKAIEEFLPVITAVYEKYLRPQANPQRLSSTLETIANQRSTKKAEYLLEILQGKRYKPVKLYTILKHILYPCLPSPRNPEQDQLLNEAFEINSKEQTAKLRSYDKLLALAERSRYFNHDINKQMFFFALIASFDQMPCCENAGFTGDSSSMAFQSLTKLIIKKKQVASFKTAFVSTNKQGMKLKGWLVTKRPLTPKKFFSLLNNMCSHLFPNDGEKDKRLPLNKRFLKSYLEYDKNGKKAQFKKYNSKKLSLAKWINLYTRNLRQKIILYVLVAFSKQLPLVEGSNISEEDCNAAAEQLKIIFDAASTNPEIQKDIEYYIEKKNEAHKLMDALEKTRGDALGDGPDKKVAGQGINQTYGRDAYSPSQGKKGEKVKKVIIKRTTDELSDIEVFSTAVLHYILGPQQSKARPLQGDAPSLAIYIVDDYQSFKDNPNRFMQNKKGFAPIQVVAIWMEENDSHCFGNVGTDKEGCKIKIDSDQSVFSISGPLKPYSDHKILLINGYTQYIQDLQCTGAMGIHVEDLKSLPFLLPNRDDWPVGRNVENVKQALDDIKQEELDKHFLPCNWPAYVGPDDNMSAEFSNWLSECQTDPVYLHEKNETIFKILLMPKQILDKMSTMYMRCNEDNRQKVLKHVKEVKKAQLLAAAAKMPTFIEFLLDMFDKNVELYADMEGTRNHLSTLDFKLKGDLAHFLDKNPEYLPQNNDCAHQRFRANYETGLFENLDHLINSLCDLPDKNVKNSYQTRIEMYNKQSTERAAKFVDTHSSDQLRSMYRWCGSVEDDEKLKEHIRKFLRKEYMNDFYYEWYKNRAHDLRVLLEKLKDTGEEPHTHKYKSYYPLSSEEESSFSSEKGPSFSSEEDVDSDIQSMWRLVMQLEKENDKNEKHALGADFVPKGKEEECPSCSDKSFSSSAASGTKIPACLWLEEGRRYKDAQPRQAEDETSSDTGTETMSFNRMQQEERQRNSSGEAESSSDSESEDENNHTNHTGPGC